MLINRNNENRNYKDLKFQRMRSLTNCKFNLQKYRVELQYHFKGFVEKFKPNKSTRCFHIFNKIFLVISYDELF